MPVRGGVAEHATARSTAVAVAVDGGDRLTFGGIERRSNRLARGLQSLGVQSGDHVAILCCDRHAPDLFVGYLGVHKAGAVAVVLPLGLDAFDMGRLLHESHARVALACAEGAVGWRRSGGRGVLVADEPGVVWWRALELRESAAPLEPALPTGDLVASVAVGGDWSLRVVDADEVAERTQLPFPTNGVLVHAVPMATLMGLHPVGLAALAAGITQVVQTPFDADRLARMLPRAGLACLLPGQVDVLVEGTDWVAVRPGLCWWAADRHPSPEYLSGAVVI